MTIRVTAEGLLIPKEWLSGIDEVDLQRQGDRIIIVPVSRTDSVQAHPPAPGRRSVYELGKNPVITGITDGAERHDFYIYGDPHGEQS